MKNIKNYIFFAAISLFVVGCQNFNTDLDVLNLENPDDKILTSDPVALDALSTSIIHNWFMATHSTNGPGAAFATMADLSTCSWGNFGMRDTSSEPRVAFNNSTSYSNSGITNSYFNSLYSVLSDSNTLALAVANGTKFADVNTVSAVAKLGQALSIGHLALVFDQVWLSDETGVVAGTGTEGSSTYKEAMTFALARLDEAIAIVKANNITLSESFIPGGGGSNAKLVQFMNSMGARMLVGNVRNKAQKAAIDWNKVWAYANAGLSSDFDIYMDDVQWYDLIPKTYMVYPGWAQVDMRVINMMDSNIPAYWVDGVTSYPASTSASADKRLASDFGYLGSQSFRPARGQYHFSNYRYKRYDSYITNWTENVTEFSASENDMYKAEALANKAGADLGAAAALINAGTRVTRGGLTPVGANLVDITNAIHHERMVEFGFTAPGIAFYEMRKENLLQAGTLLHFPVPGTALESIPTANYTFGGTDGVAGEDYSTAGWR